MNSRVFHTPAAMVARGAVLVPLYGAARTDDQLLDQAARLQAQWHARIHALGLHGWDMVTTRERRVRKAEKPTANSRKTRMYHCPSAFVLSPGKRTPCTVSAICPHCWARQALEAWRKIDARLYGTPRRIRVASATAPVSAVRALQFDAPLAAGAGGAGGAAEAAESEVEIEVEPARLEAYDLLERTVVSHLNLQLEGETPRAYLSRYLAHRFGATLPAQDGVRPRRDARSVPARPIEIERFRRLGIAGGLETTTIDLWYEPGEGRVPGGWQVTTRQLLLLPRGAAPAILDNPHLRTTPGKKAPQLRLTARPTRRAFALAVARAYRYPTMLLRGPERLVIDALVAREQHQLSATFRCLRGKARPLPNHRPEPE